MLNDFDLSFLLEQNEQDEIGEPSTETDPKAEKLLKAISAWKKEMNIDDDKAGEVFISIVDDLGLQLSDDLRKAATEHEKSEKEKAEEEEGFDIERFKAAWNQKANIVSFMSKNGSLFSYGSNNEDNISDLDFASPEAFIESVNKKEGDDATYILEQILEFLENPTPDLEDAVKLAMDAEKQGTNAEDIVTIDLEDNKVPEYITKFLNDYENARPKLSIIFKSFASASDQGLNKFEDKEINKNALAFPSPFLEWFKENFPGQESIYYGKAIDYLQQLSEISVDELSSAVESSVIDIISPIQDIILTNLGFTSIEQVVSEIESIASDTGLSPPSVASVVFKLFTETESTNILMEEGKIKKVIQPLSLQFLLVEKNVTPEDLKRAIAIAIPSAASSLSNVQKELMSTANDLPARLVDFLSTAGGSLTVSNLMEDEAAEGIKLEDVDTIRSELVSQFENKFSDLISNMGILFDEALIEFKLFDDSTDTLTGAEGIAAKLAVKLENYLLDNAADLSKEDLLRGDFWDGDGSLRFFDNIIGDALNDKAPAFIISNMDEDQLKDFAALLNAVSEEGDLQKEPFALFRTKGERFSLDIDTTWEGGRKLISDFLKGETVDIPGKEGEDKPIPMKGNDLYKRVRDEWGGGFPSRQVGQFLQYLVTNKNASDAYSSSIGSVWTDVRGDDKHMGSLKDSYLPIGFLLSEETAYEDMLLMYNAKKFKSFRKTFSESDLIKLLNILNNIFKETLFSEIPSGTGAAESGGLDHLSGGSKKKVMAKAVDAAGGKKQFTNAAAKAAAGNPAAIDTVLDAMTAGMEDLSGGQISKMSKNIQDSKIYKTDNDNLILERWQKLAGLL